MPGVHHPVFARLYPSINRAAERRGLGVHRRALLTGLSGEIVEVGAGDGANFPYYPGTVARVLAVEPEPRLRGLARDAARRAPVPVEVVDGLAERLPVPDASADAVVFALVLCSLPDVDAALAEAARVLRPGGRLCFLEHVRADSPGLVRVQRVMDATFWPLVAGGCHTGRDTAAAVERSGFVIGELHRFLFADVRGPMTFFIRGTATPPPAGP